MFRILKPPSCVSSGCPLAGVRSGFVEPEGSGALRVLMVGEAAGEHESRDGYPFRSYAEAGSLLNRAIGMAGYKREQFGIFNVLACRPPNNELAGMPYEVSAAEHCRVHLLNVIRRYQPKVILALGAVAVRALTGLTGDRLTLEYIRGFCLDSNIDFSVVGGAGGRGAAVRDSDADPTGHHDAVSGGSHIPVGKRTIPVVGTYHPSHIKRGAWALLPVLVKDIKFAVQVAQHGPPSIDNLNYVTHGNVGHLEQLRDYLRHNPDVPLSIDIETNYCEMKEEIFSDPELVTPSMKMAAMDTRVQEITQINYSTQEETALVVSAVPAHMALVKEIHAAPNTKVGHNIWLYDKPHCEENGLPLSGVLEDTMWRFHHIYPDLPGSWKKKSGDSDYSEDGSIANLQFCASFYGFPFPWKHQSNSNPEWYGGADADSALRVFWGTYTDMDRLGITDGYYNMVQALLPILERMRLRGIPVNRQTLLELHQHLTGRIRQADSSIQEHAPVELRPLDPKTGLKRPPKDAYEGKPVVVKRQKKGEVELLDARLIQIEVDIPGETKNCCIRPRKPSAKTGIVKACYTSHPQAHMRMVKGVETLFSPNPDCPKCEGTGVLKIAPHTEVRWARELPFNAASPDQMWGYVHYRGYEVKKNSKRVFAMDAETIDKLAKRYGDPLFGLCVEKRKLVKMDSTYCLGWMPGDDGRVHPQVGCYPATGQLSSRRPNSQNCPSLSKQGEMAVAFRKAIWAEPSHAVVELDLKSFHVQTLGFECGDPVYIGLAKTDIHSFFAVTGLLKAENRDTLLTAAQANLGKGKADPELKARLKWYRKNYTLANGDPFDKLRDEKAKVVVLAYGLGMGERTLFLKNEDSFSSIDDAKRTLQAMDATFEKEKRFRDTKPLSVKPNGYKLVNRYGFIRWFFCVQKLDRRNNVWIHGDDWEAAIAFDVQATAHGHLREIIKRNEYAGYNDRYEFINTVHDSLVFHPRVEDVEECINNVRQVCEHESEYMLMEWDGGRGLSVEAEAKMGPTWGEMKEWTN